MREIPTTSDNLVFFDSNRNTYFIRTPVFDINMKPEYAEFTVVTASLLIEKKDKNDKLLSPGITTDDLQSIVDDIENKPERTKPANKVLEVGKKVLEKITSSTAVEQFKKTLLYQSQEGFTHPKLTDDSIKWFKDASKGEQKLVIQAYPTMEHKLEKYME